MHIPVLAPGGAPGKWQRNVQGQIKIVMACAQQHRSAMGMQLLTSYFLLSRCTRADNYCPKSSLMPQVLARGLCQSCICRTGKHPRCNTAVVTLHWSCDQRCIMHVRHVYSCTQCRAGVRLAPGKALHPRTRQQGCGKGPELWSKKYCLLCTCGCSQLLKNHTHQSNSHLLQGRSSCHTLCRFSDFPAARHCRQSCETGVGTVVPGTHKLCINE